MAPQINDYAHDVLTYWKSSDDKVKQFDPTLLISIIMAVFQALRDCNLSKNKIKSPGIIARWQLRGIVQKAARKANVDWAPLYRALLYKGEYATDLDIRNFMNELGK